jgi:hypothetical protein
LEGLTIQTFINTDLQPETILAIENAYRKGQIRAACNKADPLHVVYRSGAKTGRSLPRYAIQIYARKAINITDDTGVNAQGHHCRIGSTGLRLCEKGIEKK